MSEIGRLPGLGLPPARPLGEASPSVATRRAQLPDVEAPPRSSLAAASSLLPPPAPPATQISPDAAHAAETLAAQLKDLGSPHTSSDDLLAAFLKLQVLDASSEQAFENLLDAGRSALLRAAYDELRTSRLEQASNLYAQAEQMETKSDAAAAEARTILSEAGVSEAEMQRLYEESVAAGKGGADVAERYRASRPANYDPERLKRETAAIDKAMPHAQEAAIAGEAGEALAGQAAAIENNIALALYATETTNHGARSDKAQARIAGGQQDRARDLMSLLADARADRALLADAALELDRSRNAVAKLLLDFIDRRASATAGRLRDFSAT